MKTHTSFWTAILTIWTSTLAGTAWAGGPPLDVRINEVRLGQTGANSEEFFELIRSSTAQVSLSNLTYLVIGDGVGGSGEIEAVISLNAQSIPADQRFFVVAEATFTLGVADFTTTLDFEDDDNVTHLLVFGFTGALGDDLDTNDDGVLDSEPWTGVLDCLAIVGSAMPPTAGAEFTYCSDSEVGPDGLSPPAHVFRAPDGGGGTTNPPFAIGFSDPAAESDTPGASNVAAYQASIIADDVIGTAGSTTTVSVSTSFNALANGALGFSFGLRHLDADLEALSVAEGSGLPAAGAAFFNVSLTPVGGLGVTVGAVADFVGVQVIPSGLQQVAIIEYAIAPAIGATTITLTFTNDLSPTMGSPNTTTLITLRNGINSVTALPAFDNGSVTIPSLDPTFLRGDANGDTTINISDYIAMLMHMFGGAPAGCRDAYDVNDDGVLTITDPMYGLVNMFAGGPAIPAPNSCGPDPTTVGDSLDCVVQLCAN